jgi:apolipoprotein N-acyltransferase
VVVAGVLLGAAFLGENLGFLAWIAFVPLLAALEGRAAEPRPLSSAFRAGYAFGFVFFLVSLHWIARLSNVAITVPWLKYPAWIVAAAYLGLFPALATWLSVALTRRSGLSLAATFVPAWLLVEELRGSGELGFPWFQAGYTQHAYPPLIQMASLGSVTLVTAWVLLVNVLLWRAWAPHRAPGAPRPSRALAIAGLLLTVVLPWLWGLRVLAAAPQPKEPRPVIALVQGNIPGEIKWAGQHQREILTRFLDLSHDALTRSPRPALVVWPETATGSYLRRQLDQTLEVARFAVQERVPVFAGFPDYRIDSLGVTRYYNAAGIFHPSGMPGAIYAKRHLVPVGERMPFQRWFPQLGRLELGQAEWTPGHGTVLFSGPGGRFAPLICFESIFPDLARQDVRRGARWLVNITNDEWFGNSAAIHQHAAMAVFRAVENHVPLARCANTGLTLMVDAYGRVTRRLPILVPEVLTVELPPPAVQGPDQSGPLPTLFTQVGDWPGWLALFVVATLCWPRRAREPQPR